ncbi:hypothetical protein [Sphingomonas endolithica]|uniref:hypothetical protein n=1 Tax=Sphingomonas endolithica TaxID=2972485 RepID=UPI0021AFDAA9|nr:hypothetical protein [Sphingomonas sp. ZFBP2030]
MPDASETRVYYSARKAGGVVRIDFDTLEALFGSAYEQLQSDGYYDEAFGYSAEDGGDAEGAVGGSVETYVLFTLMKPNLWPILERLPTYSEADLFDMIEFLFDHVSKPQHKQPRNGSGRKYHYSNFNTVLGRSEYRHCINMLLERYGPGYELNEHGELIELAPAGSMHLFVAERPATEVTVKMKPARAVDRFRRWGVGFADR